MIFDPLSITQIGQYPVRRFIAQGGMAWVYEVEDPRFEGQEVIRALKMLKPEAAVGQEFLRFRQEASLLAAIDHPNLVTIFDFGKDEETGCFFYVMTYVDGPTMADYIRQYEKLELDAVAPLFLDILSALGELHDRGIVHRDIKPANILIGSDNRARLSDLGIARAESSELETRTNMALGTVKFMAPEQARGKRIGPESDVFAVGLTLFHALTGEYVYDQIEGVDSTSHLDILGYLNSLERTGESIEFKFNSDLGIPRAIQAIVHKAVSYKQEDRYADARAMHEALNDALYGGLNLTTLTRTRTPFLVAAGVVAAAAVGYGIYIFVVIPMMLESEVEALAKTIRPLRIEVPATLQRLRDVEGAISLDLVDEVETAIGNAQTAWQYAQEGIDDKEWKSAINDLRRARSSFVTACEVLGRGELRSQAATAIEGFEKDVSKLGQTYKMVESEAKPSASTKRTLGTLQTTLAEMRAPAKDEPCAPIVHALAQIAAVTDSAIMIRSLENDLGKVGPAIAQAARDTADEARRRAEADSVRDREYRDEIASGDQLLRDGDRLISSQPLRARDVYDAATQAFTSAADAIPAIRARNQLRQLQADVPGPDGPGQKASQFIEEASSHFANKRWTKAERAYRKAEDLISVRLDRDEREELAAGRRKVALDYRSLALEIGADNTSRTQMDTGERAFTMAEKAMTAGQFAKATKHFEEASQIYRDARSAASAAVQSARDSKTGVLAQISNLLDGDGCPDIESPQARTDCEAGIMAAARGHTALDENRIQEASRLYANATRALSKAEVEERTFQNTKPQPPRITARFPRSKTVDVLRGTPQRLEVTAHDPNTNDRLSYVWRFDGEVVATVTGNTFVFTPKRAGKVSVTIADGTASRAHTLEEVWQIGIKNLPPELTVIPKGTISLSRAQPQKFTAKAKDPDGTPISTNFLLNGKLVSRTSEYIFKETRPGDYRLEVVTRDADGATARATRIVRVTNLAPVLTVSPKRNAGVEAGQILRFEATATDPEKTPVRVTYKIDGKPERRGNSYDFVRTAPGSYTVQITAQDADGLETTEIRNVDVRAGTVFPPATAAWERGVYDALVKYETAIEAKDMSKLELVWKFNPRKNNRQLWNSRFKKTQNISITLEVEPPRQLPRDQAEVKFLLSPLLDGNPARRYMITATLLKRMNGWQIIKYARKQVPRS